MYNRCITHFVTVLMWAVVCMAPFDLGGIIAACLPLLRQLRACGFVPLADHMLYSHQLTHQLPPDEGNKVPALHTCWRS